MPELFQVGTDPSGRPVLMTAHMRDWWAGVMRHLDFTPVIVQGAWMRQAGGGASDSGGFHDFGGCLDLRTWDRSTDQQLQMIRVLRLGGAAAWRRTPAQGFDEHIHLVLGSDPGIGADAEQQWRNYLAGDAGLDGPQRDNEWRPNPIVTFPPDDYMEAPVDEQQENRIADKAADRVIARLAEARFTSPENSGAKWSLDTYLKKLYKKP